MERSSWKKGPKPSRCHHSLRSYGFNRFLERIRSRSRSPSNSALSCQECERAETDASSRKKMNFGAKVLWVCLDCGGIFCGAENLGQPDSHILSHEKRYNHTFAIPIAAWCLDCKSVQQIIMTEGSMIEVKKGLGGVQQGDFDNLVDDYVVRPMQHLGDKELETNKKLEDSMIKGKEGLGGEQQGDFDNLVDYVVRPMQNLGNTSFFNAILQSLLSMSVLRAKFMKLDSMDRSITHDLWTLFLNTEDILEDDMNLAGHADLHDSICGRAPSYRGQHEQDSHGFLRQLLTLLIAEGTGCIQDIFGGKISSTVSCAQCGNASKSCGTFLDLSLAIPSNEECSTRKDEISSCLSRGDSSLQEQCLSEETSIVPRGPESVDLSSQFSGVKPDVCSRKRHRFEVKSQSGDNYGDPLSIEKCLDLFLTEPETLCGEYDVCDHCRSNRPQDRPQTEVQGTSENDKLKEGERPGGHEVMDHEVKKPATESKDKEVDTGGRRMLIRASIGDEVMDELKTREVERKEEEEGGDIGSIRKAEMKASKRCFIFKTPRILTIHLKRFTRETNGDIKKINSRVSFQEMLDLTPYMDPSCEDKEKPLYRLIGVVEHLGADLSGGHYVAYVRGVRSDQQELAWFRTSDVVVREASLNQVLNSEAYILFYKRM